jgi:cytochrome c biogenesis protein CcdA
MVDKGDTIRTSISAVNTGGRSLRVRFVPTCACLRADPPEATLPPGASRSFEIAFDTSDDEGKTDKSFIVETDPPSAKPLYFLLSGVVRGSNIASGGPWLRRSPGATGALGTTFGLVYYYTPGCRSCEDFLGAGLSSIEKELGVRIEVTRRDLLDPDAYSELAAFAASLGQELRAMPALRAGGALLQGDDEIREGLPSLLRSAAEGRTAAAPNDAPETSAAAKDAAAARIGFLSVAIAGLVDGVNPCAFTTLIFLLSSLALAGRGRREMLIIGSLFSLAVFATYTAIGLGLFAALRAANEIALVGRLLRWALAAVLVGLAGASLYDYSLVRRGRAGEILLQLPGFLKLRIHEAIRNRARKRARALAVAGSSLVLGFLVSIFEFACSGQVYLPTLAYLARTKSGGVGLLVAYNLFFIAPLLAVFVASYLGAGSRRIAEIFSARMGAVKLALAAVFLALAILTLTLG